MKNITLIYSFIIFTCGTTMAQGIIQWQNTISGNRNDELSGIAQTADGGYILAGSSTSTQLSDKTENCLGFYDYWVIKLDAAGNIQWQNTIGGNSDDYLNSIKQTADGGFILGGYSKSNISGDKTENCLAGSNDYWIVKLDVAGNIQWQNTIGGTLDDFLKSVTQTSDGGYILGGYSQSNISGDKSENSMGSLDFWAVKLDASGNIQWQNTIGGNQNDVLNSIAQTADGGYILGGNSLSNISGDKTENNIGGSDYWIVKLNAAGNVQWQNSIGGSDDEAFFTVIQTVDEGYYLGGHSNSGISGDKAEASQGMYDCWVVRLDSSGNVTWENTIGGNDDDWLFAISLTTDGGCILGASSTSGISGDKTEDYISGNGAITNWEDYWVIKMDSLGNIQWQNTIGGSYQDMLKDITQTSDGGYFVGGWSFSNISGDKTENNSGWGPEYWVVKLFPDNITSISTPTLSISELLVFPNPLSCSTTISFSLSKQEKVSVKLMDVNGRLVSTLVEKNFETGSHQMEFDAEKLNAGIYFLKVQSDGITRSVKLVVTK